MPLRTASASIESGDASLIFLNEWADYGKNEIRKCRYDMPKGSAKLSEVKTISVKLPEAVYQEMALRIPEGDRSNFIREAISEKLEKTPKADKVLALEERMGKIEGELGQIRKYLADLELLTFQHGKTNPHSFCLDEVDHKIMEYLTHYKSATTPGAGGVP